MGSELVDNSASLDGVGDDGSTMPTLSCSKIFWQCLPQYMAMGMTYDEFWNCDPQAYKAYREKYQISYQHENEVLWLQGMYIYEALCDVAPRFNSLKPKKGADYPKKPYDIFKTEEPKYVSVEDKGKAKMDAWMERVNKKYDRRNI